MRKVQVHLTTTKETIQTHPKWCIKQATFLVHKIKRILSISQCLIQTEITKLTKLGLEECKRQMIQDNTLKIDPIIQTQILRIWRSETDLESLECHRFLEHLQLEVISIQQQNPPLQFKRIRQ